MRIFSNSYGVYSSIIDKLINKGTIKSEADGNNAKAYGITSVYDTLDIPSSDYITHLENYKDITVIANGIEETYAYGILTSSLGDIDKSIGGLTNTNTGTISVKATGDLDAYVSGVEFDSAVKIENNGQISVEANSTGGDAEAYAFGIYAYDTLDNFSNTGTIKVIDNATNGYAYAEGIHALYIENFNNNGNIEITTIGFDTEIYGIYTGEITNFTNNGTLSVTANTNEGYCIISMFFNFRHFS